MAATFALTQARALLLRGTEGEVVADARRQPQMSIFVEGQLRVTLDAQTGSLTHLPELPTHIDAHTTAQYTQSVLSGELPIPAPIAKQVQAAFIGLHLSDIDVEISNWVSLEFPLGWLIALNLLQS